MKRKRQIVMITHDYRLTIVDEPWTASVERKDGRDAMGSVRWIAIKRTEYEGLFEDLTRDVALNLLARKRRRSRK